MAREEHDREDLMRDATAYSARAQWQVPFCSEPVFVGFRTADEPSFYFGQDQVYHFNSAGELRRAFLHGKLIKAEQGGLIELTRQRQAGAVLLVRRELSDPEVAILLQEFSRLLELLACALQDASLRNDMLQLDGEVFPAGWQPAESVADLVLAWRQQHPRPGIARSARSG